MKKLIFLFIISFFTAQLLAQCNLSDSKTPPCNLVYYGDFENLDKDCYLEFTNFVISPFNPNAKAFFGNSPDICEDNNKSSWHYEGNAKEDLPLSFNHTWLCVDNTTNAIVKKKGTFLHTAAEYQKNNKLVYMEGMSFPLKEELKIGQKYKLSLEVLSGCRSVAGIALSTTTPCAPISNISNSASLVNPFQVTALSPPLITTCATLSSFTPFLIGLDLEGTLKWETREVEFTCTENFKYITLYGPFNDNINYPTQRTSSVYFDNISITKVPTQPIVNTTVTKNCVGGELEIKYEICTPSFNDNIDIKAVTVSLSQALPAGVTYKSTTFTPFSLPKNGVHLCQGFTMTFAVDPSVKTYKQEDIVVDITYGAACVNDLKLSKATPVTFKPFSAQFDIKGACPLELDAKPYASDPSAVYTWSIIDQTNKSVIYTNSGTLLDYIIFTKFQTFKYGLYTITLDVKNTCGKETYSQDIVIDCPGIKCACPTVIGGDQDTYSSVQDLKKVPFKSNPKFGYDPSKNTYYGCASIGGILTIDDDIILDAVTFKMSDQAKILVQSGKKLTIQNKSLLEGCTRMWQGIELEYAKDPSIQPEIDIQNSTIQDAEIAILLHNGPKATIIGNNFNRNNYGIKVEGLSASKRGFVNLIKPITRNTFNGLTGLIAPKMSEISKAGVALDYAFLLVGDPTNTNLYSSTEPTLNKFTSMRNGFQIRKNSILKANLAEMNNNKLAKKWGSEAINIENSYASISSMGFDMQDTDNPGRIHYGINANKSTTYLSDISIKNVSTGVRNTNPVNFIMENSTISYLLEGIENIGVSTATLTSNVKNSSISFKNPYVFKNKNDCYGINFSNFSAPKQGFIVSDVTINVTNPYVNKGIGIQNSNSIRITDSKFNINSTTFNPTAGISPLMGIWSSVNCSAKNNNFVGDDSDGSNLFGIRNVANQDLTLCCSNFTNLDYGVAFYDLNSNTKLRHNEFVSASTPLFCDTYANIYVQKNPRNKWIGINPSIFHDAYNNPTAIKNMKESAMIISEPFVVGNNASLQYWSNNFISPPLIKPGQQYDPGNKDWFQWQIDKDYDCDTDSECTFAPLKPSNDVADSGKNGFPELTLNDTTAATHTHRYYDYGEATDWKVGYQLYLKLIKAPFLMEGNELMQVFYKDCLSNNISRFASIEEKMAQLYEKDNETQEQLTTLEGEINGLEEQIQGLDAQIKDLKESSEIKELNHVRNEVFTVLNSNIEKYYWIFDDFKSKIPEKIKILQEENTSIESKSIWEKNEQTYNEIYLATVLSEDNTLTETQAQKIADIAFQCEMDGGRIVHKARILYQNWTQTLFAENEYCQKTTLKIDPEIIPITSKVAKKFNEIRIYPNPTQTELTISVGSLLKDNTLLMNIVSITGELLHQQKLTSDTERIDVSTFNAGIYILQLYDNSNKSLLNSQKLTIIK